MCICKYCNKEFHDKKRPNGTKCNSCDLAKRRWKKKSRFVNLKGGKCVKCGYNKNVGALQFHHIKDKIVSLDTRNLDILTEDVILQELEKCILLCANCHAEEHCNYDQFERFYSDAKNK